MANLSPGNFLIYIIDLTNNQITLTKFCKLMYTIANILHDHFEEVNSHILQKFF